MDHILEIRIDGSTILRIEEESVLLPLEETERAQAFVALTDALALLAGIRMPDARATDQDQCCSTTERSGDHRRSGVVVPLRLLSGRDNEAASSDEPQRS